MNKKLLPVAVTIVMVLSFLVAIPAAANSVDPPLPEKLWSYNTTWDVTDIATGDVNGDGKDDVASIEVLPVNLHVISGDGPPPLWSKPIAGYAVAVGDITGDGENEVIVGGWNSTPPPAGGGNLDGGVGFIAAHALYAYDKDGNLLWPPYPTDESIKDIEIGDVDGDGIDDVVACTSSMVSSIYVINGTGHNLPGWPVSVPPPGLGKADSPGGLGNPGIDGGGLETVITEEVIDLAVGQLDGKAGVDVAGIGPSGGCLYVFNSTGGLMWSNDISGRTVEIGDVDGDGDNEVVAVDYDMAPVMGGFGSTPSGGWVLAYDGDEGGAPLYRFYTEDYEEVTDIELGDLDGNPADVEVAAITDPTIARLYAIDIDSPPAGQLMWSYLIDWPTQYYGESLAIGDVDRDYMNEVVAATSAPTHCVYAFDGLDKDGDGVGDLVWSPYCVWEAITDLEVGDLDGDGDDDVAFGTKTGNTIYALAKVENEVETATGTGIAYFDSDPSTLEDLTAVSESELPEEGKPDIEFPHGFFSFNITLPEGHTTAIVTITLPSPVPVGTQYWKYGPTPGDPTDHWYQLLVGDNDGDNVITITLVDGGLGDDNVGAPDGVIVDQGGPGFPVPPVGGEAYPVNKISVLAPWIVLAVLLAGGISWFTLRRRRTQS